MSDDCVVDASVGIKRLMMSLMKIIDDGKMVWRELKKGGQRYEQNHRDGPGQIWDLLP